MDLYGVLGVDRGVDAKGLRRAYRSAAKQAHPDGGGSVEAFERVSLALEVLSDPVRRARYDTTGQYEAGVVDNREAELMNLVAGAMEEVVGGLIGKNRDPAGADLVDLLKACFETRNRAHAGQRSQLGPVLAKWEKLAVRFERVGEGANRMGQLASGKVEAVRQLMTRCDQQVELGKAAIELLKDYRFKADPGSGHQGSGNSMLDQMQQMQQRGRMW